MKIVTLEILDDKALRLLKDLELLKVIRLRPEKVSKKEVRESFISKYKGAMTVEPLSEIDKQLGELRQGWE